VIIDQWLECRPRDFKHDDRQSQVSEAKLRATGTRLAWDACNAYNSCMQYTIRNIPDYLDSVLRGSAREQGKSLNEVAIEALARGAGLGDRRERRRELGDIAGSWVDDPAFDSALAAQDTVDEEMWR